MNAGMIAVPTVISPFRQVAGEPSFAWIRPTCVPARTFDSRQAKLKRQAEHWQNEFSAEGRRQEVVLRAPFHMEQYRYRLSSYSAVMRTLGAVVSVDAGHHQRHEVLPSNESLQSIAEALYDHLYGEAGLLMTFRTRSWVHAARLACLHSLENSESSEAEGPRTAAT